MLKSFADAAVKEKSALDVFFALAAKLNIEKWGEWGEMKLRMFLPVILVQL